MKNATLPARLADRFLKTLLMDGVITKIFDELDRTWSIPFRKYRIIVESFVVLITIPITINVHWTAAPMYLMENPSVRTFVKMPKIGQKRIQSLFCRMDIPQNKSVPEKLTISCINLHNKLQLNASKRFIQ